MAILYAVFSRGGMNVADRDWFKGTRHGGRYVLVEVRAGFCTSVSLHLLL